MKRIFGFGKKKKHKKRLSPSVNDAESLRASHPLFQYARNEYAQTVASGTSNDDGRGVLFVPESSPEHHPIARDSSNIAEDPPHAAAAVGGGGGGDEEDRLSAVEATASFHSQHQQNAASVSVSVSAPGSASSHSMVTPTKAAAADSLRQIPTPEDASSQVHHSLSNTSYRSAASVPAVATTPTAKTATHAAGAADDPAGPRGSPVLDNSSPTPDAFRTVQSSGSFYSQIDSTTYRQNNKSGGFRLRTNPYIEPIMPDAMYEEEYGDAYIGGPIKYVYPSGYQSMRPRSGPWKLSIIVSLLFTWLSVFIVGHCSDRVDYNQYYQYEIDDDIVVIETRWCGSRILYMMWVISMLVTGLAVAYCSVIGYIKVRDFAVANSRSQPPGKVGKSDFYVRVDDTHASSLPQNHADVSLYSNNSGSCHVPIYQADGTPQFWGGHIYRPTQAAVAITSR